MKVYKYYEKKAPIALFVYNRKSELEKTITYLQKNFFSSQTELYIFSDGPKNNKKDVLKVKKVRSYIKSIKSFKKIYIFERKENLGLGSSIINGINKVFLKHDKVIVLEDDLITNKNFLKYMNNALNLFKNDNLIYHINAFNHPVLKQNVKSPDYFLSQVVYSWGWATWKNKWKIFSHDTEKLILKLMYSREFDFNNSYFFFPQLIANYRGKINSWAIYWYASIFLNKKLSIMPKKSFIRNIGYNQKATHTNIVLKKYLIKNKKLNFKYNQIKNKVYFFEKYNEIIEKYFKDNSNKNLKSIFIVTLYCFKVLLKNILKKKIF
jgi:hypothetical protein